MFVDPKNAAIRNLDRAHQLSEEKISDQRIELDNAVEAYYNVVHQRVDSGGQPDSADGTTLLRVTAAAEKLARVEREMRDMIEDAEALIHHVVGENNTSKV